MPELSPQHLSILERAVAQGFTPTAFPLYANAIGLRKGNCAALLEPLPAGGFHIFGEPFYLLEGNLTVRVNRAGRVWFVWKKLQVEATPERLAELDLFVKALNNLLTPTA